MPLVPQMCLGLGAERAYYNVNLENLSIFNKRGEDETVRGGERRDEMRVIDRRHR